MYWGFFLPLALSLSVYLDDLLVYTRWSLGGNIFKIAVLREVWDLSDRMTFYKTARGWY